MSHLVVQGLCLVAFAALALATRRQQRDLFGTVLRRSTTLAYRIAGAALLLLAFVALASGHGSSVGLVMFSGHTTLAAALTYCGLIAYARLGPPRLRMRVAGD